MEVYKLSNCMTSVIVMPVDEGGNLTNLRCYNECSSSIGDSTGCHLVLSRLYGYTCTVYSPSVYYLTSLVNTVAASPMNNVAMGRDERKKIPPSLHLVSSLR